MAGEKPGVMKVVMNKHRLKGQTDQRFIRWRNLNLSLGCAWSVGHRVLSPSATEQEREKTGKEEAQSQISVRTCDQGHSGAAV